LTGIFFGRINGKRQQNERKLCANDLGEKCSHLGLVSIFLKFLYLRCCSSVLRIF